MKIIKKLAEVWSIEITEFKQWISIKVTPLLLSDTVSANSDTIVFTFAGSGMPSMRSSRRRGPLFSCEKNADAECLVDMTKETETMPRGLGSIRNAPFSNPCTK